jgi:hypothetical protein
MDTETVRKLVRRAQCIRISTLAIIAGLDVDPDIVGQHYARFRQWYDYEITTDYLKLTTGIRTFKENEQ